MDEQTLIHKFLQGNETAFKSLVEKHYSTIFKLAYRYVVNAEDAEEIAQDVFVRFYHQRKKYQAKAKLTTYLFRITVNLSLNRIRDRKRKRLFSLDWLRENRHFDLKSAERDAPDQILENRERETRIQDAINALPEKQKTVLILRRYQELSYEEIAEVTGCSVSAVEARLFRARQRLRTELKGILDQL